MKQNVSYDAFVDAFDRRGRKGQYSSYGLLALYRYLIQYEEDAGEEIELDVIVLCCDYIECSIDEFRDMYSLGQELSDSKVTEWARAKTSAVYADASKIMYQQF